jgi:hypothetical protein
MVLKFGKDKVTKKEVIRIKMEVDSKAYARHSQAMRDIPFTKVVEKVEGSDILKIDYTLTARYIGDVTKALMAVKELCSDPAIVVSASCADLTQGRILFYEALKQLEAVIREIEKR